MKSTCAGIFIILLYATTSFSYNILGVFHTISKSQYTVGSTLMKELARRGHNVTIVSPFGYETSRKNYTEIVLDGLLSKNRDYLDNYRGLTECNFITRILNLYEIGDMMTTGFLQHPRLQVVLRNKQKFDLIVVDATMNEALLALGPYFNAPLIEFETTGMLSKVRSFDGKSRFLFSSLVREETAEKPCFSERLANVFIATLEMLYMKFIYLPRQENLSHIYLPSLKPSQQKPRNTPALLFSRKFVEHFKHENVIGVDSIPTRTEKRAVPKKVKEFLESAANGVIYIALNVTNPKITNNTIENIVKIFESRREHILWRNNFSGALDLPQNILVSNEVSDNTILAHPNTKLFINNGDFQDVLTAASFGIPVLAITEFLDQSHAISPAVTEKWAIEVQLNQLIERNLAETIEEIIANPVYSENALEVSKNIHDEPLKTVKSACGWVEFYIRANRKLHFNEPHQSFVEAYNIDVIAFLVFLVGLSTYAVGIVTKKIIVMAVLFYLNVNVKEKDL